MENNESPAFPVSINNGLPSGLTKREYFAAHVICGKNGNSKEIAEHALWVADELLKLLEHNPKK